MTNKELADLYYETLIDIQDYMQNQYNPNDSTHYILDEIMHIIESVIHLDEVWYFCRNQRVYEREVNMSP